jgi:hypothetical protein
MTGFIRGLFGGKKEKQQPAPKAPKNERAFYLSDDDAQTFGDIDYMRTSKTVKRTFAKKKGMSEEMESVRQISAMQKMNLDESGKPRSTSNQTSSGSPEVASEKPKLERRQADSNLDMFRNMARDIKK